MESHQACKAEIRKLEVENYHKLSFKDEIN
jgi:hypothetical protein